MELPAQPIVSDFRYSVFQYWDGPDPYSLPSPNAWRAAVGDMHVVASDADILEILTEIDPEFVEIYKMIRIAACRSDIARLLLLEKFGGLYIDMHCAVGEASVLFKMQDTLNDKDAIFFRAPVTIGHFLTNTALMARRNSPVISNIRKSVLRNIKDHYHKERAERSYVPYNIYVLSGPWAYAVEIMDPPNEFNIKENLRGAIGIQQLYEEVDRNPILTYQFYSYRTPGKHWSERQKHETLFDWS